MRRFALLLCAGVPSLLGAQGFGVYEHNTCAMARAGVTAASPCADGSAIYFSPAGLAGLSGTHLSAGVTLIGAQGNFTDDFLAHQTDLDNPIIPVPAGYLTHAFSPKLTVGIGAYAPYGLETKWPTADFEGRFVGYNTKIRSIYIQPTVGYQVHPRLKVGIGFAYITSRLELHQRADFSTQRVPGQTFTFASLGIPTGTDFADATLKADGTGFAVNFGGILKITDRLSIGGHWLTRKKIDYDGTAEFTRLLTGLVLPPNNPLNPVLGLPPTQPLPVDFLTAGAFLPDSALDGGGVSTSLIMPPQGTLGLAYKVNDKWTVMGDYQLVVWGWFNTVVINFANPRTPDITLSPRNKDTHGFRFGTEYQYSPKVMVRGGYLYHTAASPADFVTPLLPEGPRNEVTIGAGVELTPKLHGDVAYQYIKQNERRGLVGFAAGNTGLYKFSAHLFGVGLAYTF
ncbi:MAG TPA: outer membrane protein transport protein [Gemmatimonadales bacterium]|jgi:long-chain fatty acid transport protein|nr:outer membrane protein transport protein [Gemmatimonadales bacterium]